MNNPTSFTLFTDDYENYREGMVSQGDLFITAWEYISSDVDYNSLLVFDGHPKTIKHALAIPFRKNMGSPISLIGGNTITVAGYDQKMISSPIILRGYGRS